MKRYSIRRRLFQQRRFRQLLIAQLIMSLVLGFVIVPIEKGFGPIDNYFDGIWWAVTTLTTVGYGDYVPVTIAGRIVGMILQVIGAVMFGMVVAMLSAYVTRSQDEFYWGRLFERLDRMEEKMDNLHKKSDFLVKDGSDTQPDTAKKSKE